MKKITPILLLTALVFAVAATGCASKLTASAPAQIVRTAIDRDVKTSKKKTSSNKTKKSTSVSVETEIDYRYTVNGTSYDGYVEKEGDVTGTFQTGGQGVVCYNPQNPTESEVFPAGHNCGG